LGHQVGRRCEDLLRQQGDEQGWMLLELAVQPDRVHLCAGMARGERG
jgi:hypothetical protein